MMEITRIDISIREHEPSPNPKRDALQSLPGSGSVQVTVHTDTGISGSGSASFGRNEQRHFRRCLVATGSRQAA